MERPTGPWLLGKSAFVVVSGGQIGVDRAALDAAMALSIEHGGWCPRGRHAKDGKLPAKYRLTETFSGRHFYRTQFNVEDSDGTLILYRQDPRATPGTKLTCDYARRKAKPLYCVDLTQPADLQGFICWMKAAQIRVLNVAGPGDDAIYQPALDLLTSWFKELTRQAA